MHLRNERCYIYDISSDEKQKCNTLKMMKKATMKKLKCILIIVFIILLLVGIPIVFGYVIGNTSHMPNPPFTGDVWFEYWLSYIGVLLSALLDVFAIGFSLFVFYDDKISSRNGTFMVNDVVISGWQKELEKTHSTITLIDENPHLNDYNSVVFMNFELYFCLDQYVFFSNDTFKEDHINESVERFMIKIPISVNEDEMQTEIDNDKLKFTINFESNNNTFRDILYKNKYLYFDSHMLILQFNYKVKNNKVYFKTKWINDFYKNREKKAQTNHFSRVYLIRNDNTDIKEENFVVGHNVLSYQKDHEFHKIIS